MLDQFRGSRIRLIVLLAASSLTIMAGALVAPALPSMRDHFAETAQRDWLLVLVLTIPGLAIALLAPLAGLAADRFGRRPVLILGLTLYAIAGAWPVLSNDLLAIVIGSALLGASIACTMTAATALLFDGWQGRARETVIGYQGAATGVAGVLYPLIGGLVASIHWRWPFALHLLAGGLAAAAALSLPRAPSAPGPAVATVPFDWRPIAPMLALGLLGMSILYVIPIRGPFYLVELGHGAPLLIALLTTVPSAAAVVMGLRFATLQARHTPESLASLTYLLLALGFASISLSGTLAGLIVGLALCGAGFGLNAPNLMSWLRERVPPHHRGRAAGLFTMSVFMGQFVATFWVSLLAKHTTFAGTFGAVALGCLGVAALCWHTRRVADPAPDRPVT